MSIYNREILEIKKEIIMEVMNDLKSIRNFKLKANTKAYNELDKTILKLDLEINTVENSINDNNLNENYSMLKIERKTLESLINLNNRLKFETISELLESLIYNYEDIFNRGLDRFNNHLNLTNKNHLSLEIVKGDLN